ncbi:MAG: glutaredoxin family protein [bacterium]|nr:glutaredoxin family protein [bacterium]
MGSDSAAKELVMYSRTSSCPFVTLAKRVLRDYNVPFRELYYDRDETVRRRILEWTGFLSVPTLIVANAGDDLPAEPFDPLPAGSSPRGIDRGSMITEPNIEDLTAWLLKHGFIAEAAT